MIPSRNDVRFELKFVHLKNLKYEYLINIRQCLSVCPSQGFAVLNVNHKRDFGAVELGFGKSFRRPRINLQGCIVGEGTKLSTMPIGPTRVKFWKVHQMAYWDLGMLI